MSYTMTIEAPEKAAWFEQRRLKISQEQLGEIFVKFLMERPEIFECKVERWTKSDFSRFAGRWSPEEAQAFDAATSREIDEEDWK